ncbi:cation channel sperm-associated auxiliary subunit gamma [Perognathus longimembris pacificus]|uniref:cation channel sperm-associated auxiliary subunit gamma n=1 Tax=Perognathus longimembris pacificus TaxID=214514 RepID=UPI00201A15B3|nr:cation channel sperm-associated auxiliary subunit gamma [Perognathus longimembris pacificus]
METGGACEPPDWRTLDVELVLDPWKRLLGEEPVVVQGQAEDRRFSSYIARPAMAPASPVWSTAGILWAPGALLLVILVPWRLWAAEEDIQMCTWQVVLNRFHRVGVATSTVRFYEQEPEDTVGSVFSRLTDSPIDPNEEYLGFPYYLKVNFSCVGMPSERLVRRSHLMGMKPLVLVTFYFPVNFYHWKIEQLQIQMEAAPFRNKETCLASEVCGMSWYTPMPLKNGSVVMRVDVSSNGLGPFIPPKSFYMNINGFLKTDEKKNIQFTIGDEIFSITPRYFENVSSRPLRYTLDHTPVLILGGIPNEKTILITDTYFQDVSLVELSIDSCWVGSHYCPQTGFSATIQDAVSTETTLFIRQNQLVYYFTGAYTTVLDKSHISRSWVRVLANECIKKLCPVHFDSNGTEYVIALTMGKHEGYVHLGTVRAGEVAFQMFPKQWSVCEKTNVAKCSIIWAALISGEFIMRLLVENMEQSSRKKYFTVTSYNIITDELEVLYTFPEFIPDAHGLEFLMMLGMETYTDMPMIPRGMLFNTHNNLLFLWGNFLLQSYNNENFIYLADFPKELYIKFLVNSFQGDLAIVTDTEEVWYLQEGSYSVYRLLPSRGWDIYVSLQNMHHSSLFAPEETMITMFYDRGKLYQIAYIKIQDKGQVVKRLIPVEKLLMYQQTDHQVQRQGGYLKLSFIDFCPFSVMRLQDIPNPQAYTREERYLARPPHVMEQSGFHSENSLAVYQGLVYYLLWLHSKYDKPYADPEHDPTWRWWKNKKQDADYYFYLASNWRSAGGMHIDMESYEKIYDLKPDHKLPERIFLDKGTTYSFSIFLAAQGDSFRMPDDLDAAFQVQSKLAIGVVVGDPLCLVAVVQQKVLVNRKSVQFLITLEDKKVCYDQGISGHHLMKTSMMIKVLGSSGYCFHKTNQGLAMQGSLMVPVFIGCPPGKRLAFDITYTLEYNHQQNKHYFDCVYSDPEMPCFLFRDIFYPFFLIQDLVTGDSGSFNGSYVLKVVGGGPSMDLVRDYSEEEIYNYNSPLDKTKSLIWKTKTERTTSDKAFHVLSHNSWGIEWLCLENSPCHDTMPQSIFPPEFYFKVLVSNRDVDSSTYCDYQLTFWLHIHGLPLSNKRAIFIVMVSEVQGILSWVWQVPPTPDCVPSPAVWCLQVSASCFMGMVMIYIAFCLLWPYIANAWSSLRWKINNLMAAESYYTYATSTAIFSMGSQMSFPESYRDPSKIASKVFQEKEEPEPVE